MRAFITFEGIEGSGKTTQIQLLSVRLESAGVEHILTREPGGTEIGNRIRSLLLDPAHRDLTPLSELLLYQAARAQHLARVIIPALAERKLVLCDRYKDATRAYQGDGRHLPAELVETLNRLDLLALEPDLTLLFDIDPETALARARRREGRVLRDQSRFEQEDMEFHRRVRDAYRRLAASHPQRIRVLEGDGGIEEVHERVVATLRSAFPSLGLP
jgi:dTMP kinase